MVTAMSLHRHEHSHAHSHGHAGSRQFSADRSGRRRLWLALAINLVFLIVEFVGGLMAGSLALLSDAGHMLTDVAALGIAIIAAYLAARPATPRRTFGLLRAEVIGAFINGITLIVIVALIFFEAYRRIGQSVHINGPLMLVIAVLGLIANAVSAAVLASKRDQSINIQAAFLHLAADTLGSIGAIAAGVVIWATGWTPIDAIMSFVIGLLILFSTFALLKQTFGILINATPRHIDCDEVKAALEAIGHFAEVRDLHIWSVVAGLDVLTAHVSLDPDCSDTDHWQQCLAEAQKMLHERFGLEHVTLQLEPPGHAGDARTF